MPGDSERERYERLKREIARHDRLYFVEARPEISDRDYDRLVEELKVLEAAHPDWVTPDSPSQRVGGEPIADFETVEHRVPMLSIENTYAEEGLREWDERVRKLLESVPPSYVAEPKVDGVAIALHYEGGLFARGATRGDGRRGDDVTANLRTVRAIPLRLDPPDGEPLPPLLEVRGELFMPFGEFARMNEERRAGGLDPFMNPRNSTSGMLKHKDPKVVARCRLSFLAHSVGATEGLPVRAHAQLLAFLRGAGMPTVPLAACRDVEAVATHIRDFEKVRATLGYATDGVVVKVDDFRQRERCGETSKAPRWVIAYKYEAEQAATRLRDVRLQIGKSGAVTPVAILDPVPLSGTTVSRASLHNFSEIARKDIRIGDCVVIQKRGEIIPYVVRAIPEERTGAEQPIVPPTTCPRCGTPLVRAEGEVALRCPSPDCAGRLVERLKFWGGRRQMDIQGLGEKIVEQLVAAELVTDIPDLYALTAESLVSLERMGELAAANLLGGIAASRGRGLARLLAGLAVPHVGHKVAELLAERFGDLAAIEGASVEELTAIPGVGEKIARSLGEWLRSERGKALLAGLRAAGVKTTADRPGAPTGPLAGKTFVITGTLTKMSRAEAHERIRALGGRPGDSLTRKTSYLVVGADPGGKVEKAREFGVAVLPEDEFCRMIDSPPPAA
ncbi:MAG: NAD-dependent DNA ligase LigA [Planctomycetales bacterium]|nr:NAD-dependent DNA ligase LigA [Planctomycetales bacterium]